MISLRVLGGLDLRDAAGQDVRRVLAQPKRLALLAYLALTRTVHRRDELLALFWPDLDGERARLALRQAVHFLRDALGPGVISGRSGEELAIGADEVRCDATELEEAIGADRLADAMDLYRGDLLVSFHVSDVAPGLDQWLDGERGRLRACAAAAAWTLAARAERAGNGVEAAHRARQAVRLSPDDEASLRHFISLLDRLGDRTGALRAYEEYARRLRTELEIEPATETRSLIDSVRVRERVGALPAAAVPAAAIPEAGPVPAEGSRPAAGSHSRRLIAAGIAVVAVLGAGFAALSARRASTPPSGTIAVGFIQNEGGDSLAAIARLLPGLLSTDLARVSGLPVISDTRLYEILGQLGAEGPTRRTLSEAARRAGAAELIEGVLYRRPGGALRLDLRRVDARSGALRGAFTAEGTDPFEVADRITAQVAEAFALPAPATPLAAASSGSVVARRFYEEGLRAYYRGDVRYAYRLFGSALAEDSSFAMAAYYAARSIRTFSIDTEFVLLVKAEEFARKAPERERLLIKFTRYADYYPVRAAAAESLVTRFPHEPDGHQAMAQLLAWSKGDFAGAIAHARRVIDMDSLALRGTTPICRACDAFDVMLNAFTGFGTDSAAALERTAREWLARRPDAARAWQYLAVALRWQGRTGEAIEALTRAAQHDAHLLGYAIFWSAVLRGERYEEAERLLRDRLRFEPRDPSWLVMTLRHQGRIREALDLLDWRALGIPREEQGKGVPGAMLAHSMFEAALFHESARRFEALVTESGWAASPDQVSWVSVHAATALAAAGDTLRLAALADTIARNAPLGTLGFVWPLAHYVRGLLWQARGRHEQAVREFRAAIFSPTIGYTRTNLELARSLIALGKGEEAVEILREALGSSQSGTAHYLTRTEVHEQLARAFEVAGRRDSAAAHHRAVVRAWAGGDPSYRSRAEAARRRLAALER
ncbi:MAG TPA: BTAD domain-containing putative transcriptional regulator [Gemmatimonadales bacterium]|nr:BTAD domain-containing putative transcriptional regulator [Gemmatimonadales bacterium]